jgi:predicted MFS family arabinose efflux permease
MSILSRAIGKTIDHLALERSLRILLVTSLIVNLGDNLWVPLLGLYITNNLGVSTLMFGLMTTAQGLASSLTMLPSGFMSDLFGRKRIIILSYVFSILSLVILLFLNGLPFLFLVSISRGISTAFMEPSRSAYIIDLVSDEKRGKAFASLALLQSLSSIIATSVAGSIAVVFGFHWIFTISLISESISLVITAFYLKESLNRDVVPATTSKESLSIQLKNGLAILRSPSLLAVLFAIVFHQVGIGIENPYLTIYARNILMFTLPTVSLMLGSEQLGVLVGHLPSGRIVDKYGGEISFAFHILATSPTMILFTIAGNPFLASSTLFVWGLTFGLDNVSRQKLIPKYRSRSGVATAFGVVSLIAGTISLVSPTIGGWLWTDFSPQTVFYASAAVNALGSLSLFILWFHNRDEK